MEPPLRASTGCSVTVGLGNRGSMRRPAALERQPWKSISTTHHAGNH